MKFIPLIRIFFLFTGYNWNFSISWYYHVGSTIPPLLIFNIFTPHLYELVKWLIVYIVRKHCLRNIFKEKNKHKFLFWYIGPEYLLEIKLGDVSFLFIYLIILFL